MAPRHRLGWRGLAAPAIVIPLIAAACGGTIGPSAGPTASPTASVSPTVPLSPAPSATAAAEPSPLPTAGPPVGDGSIAAVAVEALQLRGGPSTSDAVLKTLAPGVRVFVIGEPRKDGDLRWHHVAVIPGDECFGICDVGWVATPSTGSEARIVASPVACPGSPVEAEDLATLHAFEHLHCYGDADFTVTGWIDTPCCSGVGPFEVTPTWLSSVGQFFRMRDKDTGGLAVYFLPGSGARLPATTVVMRATAHFDDPAASTCVARIADGVDPAEVDPDELPSADEVVLECRTHLVISAYEVVGYLPGPGCGCLPPSPRPDA